MATTEHDIENFARFAKERLANGGGDLTLGELCDEWRLANPPSEDLIAVRASLRDMEQGECGRPVEEFLDEFDARHGTTGDE